MFSGQVFKVDKSKWEKMAASSAGGEEQEGEEQEGEEEEGAARPAHPAYLVAGLLALLPGYLTARRGLSAPQ